MKLNVTSYHRFEWLYPNNPPLALKAKWVLQKEFAP